MVEGAPHTAKRSMINLCVYGVPPPLYIKEWMRGGAGPLYGAPQGGFLLLVGVGSPPSLVGVGEEGRGRGKEGKGVGPPPNSDWACSHLAASSSLSPWPIKAH